jgi:isoleucyl-tRNA synthetase
VHPRQRVWGVPIIAFYCASAWSQSRIANIWIRSWPFAKHTADIWYSRTAAECCRPELSASCAGAAEFTKESDILDVWLIPGPAIWPSYPANSSPGRPICTWKAAINIAAGSTLAAHRRRRRGCPYRGSATHGWTLDAEGRAMHKSLGNSIELDEIIKKYGAEVLRLWVASVEFTEDVRLSDTILTRLTEAYRKLRNTFRYALGNLSDFDPAVDAVPGSEMQELDQWILFRAEDLVARCRAWYDEFGFHKVYHAVYDFATVDLSSIYFDVLKDRLYTSAPRSQARRSALALRLRSDRAAAAPIPARFRRFRSRSSPRHARRKQAR